MCRHAVAGHTNGEYTTEQDTVPVPLKEMSPNEQIRKFILHFTPFSWE